MEPSDIITLRRRLCSSHGTPQERAFYLANRTPELHKRDSCVSPVPYQVWLLSLTFFLPPILFLVLPIHLLFESNYRGFLSNGVLTAFICTAIMAFCHGLDIGLRYRRSSNQDSIVETTIVATGVILTLSGIPATLFVSWIGFEKYEFAITGITAFITTVIGTIMFSGVSMMENSPWVAGSRNPTSLRDGQPLTLSMVIFVIYGLTTACTLPFILLSDFPSMVLNDYPPDETHTVRTTVFSFMISLLAALIFILRQQKHLKRRELWRQHGPHRWNVPLRDVVPSTAR